MLRGLLTLIVLAAAAAAQTTPFDTGWTEARLWPVQQGRVVDVPVAPAPCHDGTTVVRWRAYFRNSYGIENRTPFDAATLAGMADAVGVAGVGAFPADGKLHGYSMVIHWLRTRNGDIVTGPSQGRGWDTSGDPEGSVSAFDGDVDLSGPSGFTRSVVVEQESSQHTTSWSSALFVSPARDGLVHLSYAPEASVWCRELSWLGPHAYAHGGVYQARLVGQVEHACP